MKLNPILLIPARMEAARLPGKPLALIGNKPMIVHVVERAFEADIGPVVVATDDERILDAVADCGAQAVMTQKNHQSGSDRIYEALRKIDGESRFNTIINVQGDLPTIAPQSIKAALAPLKEPKVDIATLCAPITEEREATNPNIVKLVGSALSLEQFLKSGNRFSDKNCGKNKELEHLVRPSETKNALSRLRALYFTRARAPYGDGQLYHHIGLYAYRRDALARFVALPPSPLERSEKLEQLRALEAGMRIDAEIVDDVPLGVDTQQDLERARQLLVKEGVK